MNMLGNDSNAKNPSISSDGAITVENVEIYSEDLDVLNMTSLQDLKIKE